jgi:ABC-type nickel/cobalt efflux system permease component RcnA
MCLGFAAHAAEAPVISKSPFGFAGATRAQPRQETSFITTALDNAWSVLIFEQHRLTQDMTGAVRNLRSTTDVATATGALIVASFVYGILHAVGPGHGKAVISSYMLADKETLRRGIFLAFLSSLIQALSAITLIGGLYVAARATGMQTKWAEGWLETLSWGFVAVVGLWLMFKQLAPMLAHRRRAASAHDDEHVHDHALHGHDHPVGHHAHAETESSVTTHVGPVCTCGHDHTHDHVLLDDHVHDEHCGHAHLPGPEELKGSLSWSRAFAISLSIGIRPCTGALLVIIFAATQGLLWAGILATFAMAFGTALTVSALAALSVGSRNLAIALAGAESRWGNMVARSASFVSSAAVFVLGTVFFFASFHDTRPF